MVIDFNRDLISRSKIIQFPILGKDYGDYSSVENKGGVIYKLPALDMLYKHGPGHHYKTQYHYDFVIPLLDGLLHFGYNPNDFKMSSYYQNEDYLYLIPNEDCHFDVCNLLNDRVILNINFDGGLCRSTLFHDLNCGYHKLFIGSHLPVRINNKNAKIDKTLLVTCDSQMIPSMPILCYYYRTVIHMDNRSGVGKGWKGYDYKKTIATANKINDTIDDVLVSLYNSSTKRYFITNVK